MEIRIYPDGSFESLAAVDYKQKIKDAKVSIRAHKELLRDKKKAVTVATRIDRMKIAAKTASPERKAKIKSDITHLRMQTGLGPKTTLSSAKKAVLRLEKSILREQANIDKWMEKLGTAKPKPVPKSVPVRKTKPATKAAAFPAEKHSATKMRNHLKKEYGLKPMPSYGKSSNAYSNVQSLEGSMTHKQSAKLLEDLKASGYVNNTQNIRPAYRDKVFSMVHPDGGSIRIANGDKATHVTVLGRKKAKTSHMSIYD